VLSYNQFSLSRVSFSNALLVGQNAFVVYILLHAVCIERPRHGMPASFLLADLKTLIGAELEGSPFGGTICLFRWWLLIDPALFSPSFLFLLTLLRPRPLYDFPLFFLQGQESTLFHRCTV
jgi:hypothetical protein